MAFYGDVLGLTLGHLEEDRRVAFYWVGGEGEAIWACGRNQRHRSLGSILLSDVA